MIYAFVEWLKKLWLFLKTVIKKDKLNELAYWVKLSLNKNSFKKING